jgi:hypothetical protein
MNVYKFDIPVHIDRKKGCPPLRKIMVSMNVADGILLSDLPFTKASIRMTAAYLRRQTGNVHMKWRILMCLEGENTGKKMLVRIE